MRVTSRAKHREVPSAQTAIQDPPRQARTHTEKLRVSGKSGHHPGPLDQTDDVQRSPRHALVDRERATSDLVQNETPIATSIELQRGKDLNDWAAAIPFSPILGPPRVPELNH
jgi:hypothetical protein